MAKIVIDANIIISATFGGKPLEAATRAINKHSVFISKEIKQEIITVFPKLPKKLDGEQLVFIQEKINQLVHTAILVDVISQIVLSRDVKDDHYLSLCKEIEADLLITGDKDLLNIQIEKLTKEGIKTRIINPNEFLEWDMDRKRAGNINHK